MLAEDGTGDYLGLPSFGDIGSAGWENGITVVRTTVLCQETDETLGRVLAGGLVKEDEDSRRKLTCLRLYGWVGGCMLRAGICTAKRQWGKYEAIE